MKHGLEYALTRGVRALVQRLPMRAVRALGDAVGTVAYLVDGRHRPIAIDNLRAAFPGRPAAEHRRIARGVFRHLGRLVLELLKIDGMPAGELLAHVESEGDERVREAYRQGRGVLLFSGHFGYWEIFAIAHALRVAPMSLVVRPLDNPQLDTMLEGIRSQTGNRLIPRQGGVRRILRELAANHAVGILIDQHLHGPDAVHVQFFGRRAATTSALAALALRTGAPVIPVFALPLPGGRYRLVAEHPIEPPAADTPDAERELTQRCTDVLEMYVRRHPDLWLWMHRRWRDTDPGDADDASRAGEVARTTGA
ncbi:MAG: lysophospholipid acyltransferase family protein [Acidimicrobiia bacterium]|nr:lysophospholipid acyltransferase family protein [Acidimicrobiia bacterium]